MTYSFANQISDLTSDTLIATASNGVVYTDKTFLYVNNNNCHYVYNSNRWYRKNPKTEAVIFLGDRACPTIEFEDLVIKDQENWDKILEPKVEEKESE